MLAGFLMVSFNSIIRVGMRDRIRNGLVPEVRVGNEDIDTVGAMHFGGEQPDFADGASDACGLDGIADTKWPEPKQHKAGRDVGKRSLEGEPHRQQHGTEGREDAGGLDAQLLQRGDGRQEKNGIA